MAYKRVSDLYGTSQLQCWIHCVRVARRNCDTLSAQVSHVLWALIQTDFYFVIRFVNRLNQGNTQ